jgi:hypothetical protein
MDVPVIAHWRPCTATGALRPQRCSACVPTRHVVDGVKRPRRCAEETYKEHTVIRPGNGAVRVLASQTSTEKPISWCRRHDAVRARMGPTFDPPVYLREFSSGVCVPILPQWPIHWQFYLEGIGLPGIARDITRRISGRRLPGTHPSEATDGLRWEHIRREAAKWRCHLTAPSIPLSPPRRPFIVALSAPPRGLGVLSITVRCGMGGNLAASERQCSASTVGTARSGRPYTNPLMRLGRLGYLGRPVIDRPFPRPLKAGNLPLSW